MPINLVLPVVDIQDFSKSDHNHARTDSMSQTSGKSTPRSPRCSRGSEFSLAPLPVPSLPLASSKGFRASTLPCSQSTSPATTMTMSAGTSPSDHQQLSVDDQTEGLFERQAMLEGRSYNVNSWLIRKDREQCKVLLEKLNDDSAEALLLFSYMILSIFQLRPISGHLPSARNEKVGGPQGTTGDDLSVNAPFTCEFGYNLHFGSDVKIGANCYMNDASTISIGNRVRIGRNVRFECNPQVSAKLEKGIAIAREIRIGDGVVIGDNVTIFGGVIIGVGSQICANIMLTQSIGEGRHLMIYQQSLAGACIIQARRATMTGAIQKVGPQPASGLVQYARAQNVPIKKPSIATLQWLEASLPPQIPRSTSNNPFTSRSTTLQPILGHESSQSSSSVQVSLPPTCDPYAMSETPAAHILVSKELRGG